jgi:hypothetical protein
MNNLQTGQNLQNRYAAQPFSDLQNQAYQNQSNQSAYMGALVPSLLGQMSGQQVGFDRSNPNARPQAFDFNGANQAGQAAAAQNQQGLLAMLSRQQQAAPLNLNPAPAAAAPAGDFTQQVQSQNPLDQYNSLLRVGKSPEQLAYEGIDPMAGMNGGYGAFKYGMNGGKMPEPGTPEYRDMSNYFANGGVDPYNFYGRMDASKTPGYIPPQAQGYVPAGGA